VRLLAALLLLAPPPAQAIWRGDFETGDLGQWSGPPKADLVKVVTDVVREGKFAVRIDGSNAAKRGNLDRIEFQHQPKPAGNAEGAERWYGWSVYLPKKFTDGLHVVGYFETRNSWSQLMSFEARGEDLQFSTRAPYKLHWSAKGKLTAGRWHDFAVHVVWSRDPAKGLVEVWFDGENVVPPARISTLKDENPFFLQVGFARETSDVPESILIDHVVEGTTRADVTPKGR
jgi:hypothetical protein